MSLPRVGSFVWYVRIRRGSQPTRCVIAGVVPAPGRTTAPSAVGRRGPNPGARRDPGRRPWRSRPAGPPFARVWTSWRQGQNHWTGSVVPATGEKGQPTRVQDCDSRCWRRPSRMCAGIREAEPSARRLHPARPGLRQRLTSRRAGRPEQTYHHVPPGHGSRRLRRRDRRAATPSATPPEHLMNRQ